MKITRPSLFPWRHETQDTAEAELHALVAAPEYPCVGAKAALARGTFNVLACSSIDSAWDDLRIHDALTRFAAAYRDEPSIFRSFAVVFDGPDDLSEPDFEQVLWTRAQSLADKDRWLGYRYDARVSSSPDDPHFALSFGGEAFFVVGLHPNASRPGRRFARPTLVFNLHDQFEKLRADGRYETMRERIMQRDEALTGSRNPMLSRHGESSSASQYSGRVVDAAWRCPFRYDRAE